MSKKIDKLIDRIENVKTELERIRDDIQTEQSTRQDKFDDHSEAWYESDAAELAEERIEALCDASDSLEDAIDYLEGVEW